MSTPHNAYKRFHGALRLVTDAVQAARGSSPSGRRWICHGCQSKTPTTWQGRSSPSRKDSLVRYGTLHMRATAIRQQRDSPSVPEAHAPSSPPPSDLPSHSASRRSAYSKRFQHLMDDVLAKAAVAGQRVNAYTGTDYSGIERLRAQILEQEARVAAAHATVTAAKLALDTAHAAQAASQKEVVSLLERKSSWAGADLDRYTALIRSEHGHEQRVSVARQTLADAERELENHRAELERKERQQYHEEQVWSDTIRRNSTWVTFGLMGLNILLLVGNIGVVEPWRRRRLVREVRDALEEKSAATAVVGAGDEPARMATGPSEALRAVQTATEDLEEAVSMAPGRPVVEVHTGSGEAALALEDSGPALPRDPRLATASGWKQSFHNGWTRTKEVAHSWWQGPFSNEAVLLTKVELTSIALEGAVAGLAVAGCIVLIGRGA